MAQVLDIRPADRRAPRFTVALDDVNVVLRFRWLPRMSRWTMRMETPGGVQLTPQLVVQAGASVPFDTTHEDAPTGVLSWRGPETYRRQDLGDSLRLVWDGAA